MRVRDGVEVARVGGVRLVVHRLDAELSETFLEDARGLRRVRIVHLDEGDRGRAVGLRHLLDQFDELIRQLLRGRRLGEEQEVEVALEDLVGAARRLDVDVLEPLGHRSDGEVEVGRERAEDEVDVVLRDQPVVVRDRGLLIELIVEDAQLDGPAEQPAVRVELVDPVLVALDARHGTVGDGTAQRERHADDDRVTGRARLAVRAAASMDESMRVAADAAPADHASSAAPTATPRTRREFDGNLASLLDRLFLWL